MDFTFFIIILHMLNYSHGNAIGSAALVLDSFTAADLNSCLQLFKFFLWVQQRLRAACECVIGHIGDTDTVVESLSLTTD